MRTPPSRTAIAYLVLVGLPVLGLWLVLRAGGQLAAPPRLGGTYELGERAEACFGIARLDLAQSGRFLEVRGGQGVAEGRVEAGRVSAHLVAPGGPCAQDRVALRAALEDDALAGTLSAPGCSACEAVPLRAHRAAEAEE